MIAQMIPYDYVQTDRELADLVGTLRGAGCRRLAIDVEGENNLHSYGIHVALIQLYDGSRGYAVDALTIRDRGMLKALLEGVPWELVWFDAANDLLSFQHALDIRPSPILDLAIAARMLGRTGGLQSVSGAGGSASAAGGSAAVPGAPVNINSASLEELDALSGVGPATAQKIIDYRVANGPFKTVDDIKNVSGIGDAKFAAMKDSITV
jgi:comEA protein